MVKRKKNSLAFPGAARQIAGVESTPPMFPAMKPSKNLPARAVRFRAGEHAGRVLLDMNPGYSAYLKSDRWQNLRLQKLVAAGAMCHFCRAESTSNDVHHVKYPKDLRDTKLRHLRVLCRNCHTLVHDILTAHPGINEEPSTSARWRITDQHVRRRLGMKICFPREEDDRAAALLFASKTLKACRVYATREGFAIPRRISPMSEDFAEWAWSNPSAHPDVMLLMAVRLAGGTMTLKELQKPIRRKLWIRHRKLARAQ